MERRLLLSEEGEIPKTKEIAILKDPRKLGMVANKLTWRILLMLHDEELYPLEIARKLGLHEQKVYYHIRKLEKAGAVTIVREEKKKGATAKIYKPTSQAFGIELSKEYQMTGKFPLLSVDKRIRGFYKEFVKQDGSFDGKLVVGSPAPHGPFNTSARDGHYASHLTFFLGQFIKMPSEFAIKLDVDVKAEKEEPNNLILVGGPGTNVLTQEVNESLPLRFNMRPSEQGFLLGGLSSRKTSRIYTADTIGLIAKVVNPWNSAKRIIVLAGNKAVGTKACVLALTAFAKKTLRDYNYEDFAAVIQGSDLDSDGKVDSIEILE